MKSVVWGEEIKISTEVLLLSKKVGMEGVDHTFLIYSSRFPLSTISIFSPWFLSNKIIGIGQPPVIVPHSTNTAIENGVGIRVFRLPSSFHHSEFIRRNFAAGD
ncbi:hypothetical protein PAPYR_7272 [Paratrimastix pyriformis]|uniref:Uncharacterized protein n=1 Tax=Paratrimastix pyriformis TaxID=342808 RepID=A0ABQ8UDC9_9EUKA|nr:hypothetical protein PAPYR_7272 [Paratrimastix pyriformis]